jgi:uncharacterized protein YecE (DUF72 family)
VATLRVGTSGYVYSHWRGTFYPEDLARRDWFAYYSGLFDSVEMNATFYGLPSETAVAEWRERAPRGFRYAVKFSRYGSHLKRLREPHQTVAAFLERLDPLGARLGPILVQLPPRWGPDLVRLEAFLAALPRRHRWAIEFRDPGWLSSKTFALLEARGVALCIHDMIARHPRVITSGWAYLRFHGDHYQGSYSAQKLTSVARWIRSQLEAGVDVYAYFNNDADGWAPRNALDLKRYVCG